MDLSSVTSIGESSKPSVNRRHVKNRHSPEEWEHQKALIERLYLDEDKTVEETMRYLKDEKNFVVGERKFKMQLKEWGFDKNIKSSVMQLLLAKATKRKFEEDKDTKFRYKGRDILPERFSQYAKRSHVKNGKRVSPSASTPSFVSYLTISSDTSSLPGALRRAASINGSVASVASAVSLYQRGKLAVRRSLSNLSGLTFSVFKRRNSHQSDCRPMSLASLDDLSFSLLSDEEVESELAGYQARGMSIILTHGCESCQIQVNNTVRGRFEKLRFYGINFDFEGCKEVAEDLSRTMSPLCRLCHIIFSKYILSVLYSVAGHYGRKERYSEAISIYEKVMQACIEDLEYSVIMFNCVNDIVEFYAYQGLLHEVEQKILQAGAEREGTNRLALFCDRLLLANIFTLQQRPQDALKEYGFLATRCIEYYGLHSAFMHRIVCLYAEACTELHDYHASIDLYRRLLAEEDTTNIVWNYRPFVALIGLSNTYRSAGSFHNCKKYANKAMAFLRANGSALVQWDRLSRLAQCQFNLGVSFDNEGNATESKLYFSQAIAGCEDINKMGVSSEAVSIMLALQHHYYDRPRLIDTLDPKIDNYLARLADAASRRPAALQRLLIAIIWEAQNLSQSHQPQRAEYLFNQAKGVLDTGNLHLQCFLAAQIAQHHRRNGQWKDVMRCLERAAMLSEQMYGPNHACTVSFKEQLAACGEEMEKEGLSVNEMAQSLSFITLSSLNSRNTGTSESDELDFLEDGMIWGQPPASLLNFA